MATPEEIAAAAAAAALAAKKPWYDGKADAETIGHWQNQGLADKTPEEIALAATKSHREAEKRLGAPANELVRVLKPDAPEAEIKAFWNRLGAPADPKDYDFTGVEEGLANAMREAAAKLFLPKDRAEAVAKALAAHVKSKADAAAADAAAALIKEKDALNKNWGQNRDANLFVAKQAAAKLGITPEVLDAIEKAQGYAATMEFLRNVGSKIGEAKFVESTGNNQGNVMTREQAQAKLADLKADTAWSKKYMEGGSAEKREMEALLTIVTAE